MTEPSYKITGIKVVISKMWVSLFLTATLALSCNCRCPFRPHLPEFTWKPNRRLCVNCVNAVWTTPESWTGMTHFMAMKGPSSFADQPFPPLLEGINELLPFLIRSPSHHRTPPPLWPSVHTPSQSQGCVKDLPHNTQAPTHAHVKFILTCFLRKCTCC